MFSIFNGKVRGLGEQPTNRIHMRVSVKFREYLHYFKGAPLAVFMAIALHADDQGWAEPTIKQLQNETGYEPATISAAITTLCSMTIDSKRVLLAVQQRNKGKFIKNRYLTFPNAEELAQHEENERKSRTQKTVLGKTSTEKPNTVEPNTENHVYGINHSMEEPDLEEPEIDNTSLPEVASALPAPEIIPDAFSPLKDLPPLEKPYQWIVSSALGTLAHVAISANGRTLCKSSLPHRSSLNAPIGPREICPDCQTLYDKALHPDIVPLKPPKDTPLNAAVALHLQQFPAGHETRGSKELAQVIARFWKAELKVESLTAELYEKAARSVEPFVDWYKTECPGMNLPTKVDSLETWYTKFPKNGNRNKQQELVQHPDDPNRKITVGEYRSLMAQKKNAEAHFGHK
jgi:hypothetical protein